METVRILIDWLPNNFSAAPIDEEIACIATGDTLENVKKNITEALRFHVDGLLENGDNIPEVLKGEWTPEFTMTTRAQLKYCDLFLTRKALAKETGINEQQLSHYANGQRHPRPKMQLRITAGIRSICNRLTGILP